MVNAILREGSILLEGLEIEFFFGVFVEHLSFGAISVAILPLSFLRCLSCAGMPLRSTLNTNVVTGLDMCKVCTEAVHCVAL